MDIWRYHLPLTGPRLNKKTVFTVVGFPILKSHDRLIFMMGIHMLVRRCIYMNSPQVYFVI